jgi:two-component system CheB/CheR fusion protein
LSQNQLSVPLAHDVEGQAKGRAGLRGPARRNSRSARQTVEAPPSGSSRLPAESLRQTAVVAVGATAAATLVRYGLASWLGNDAPLSVFMLAVGVSAWYGGLKGGLAATLLSLLAGSFLFLEPLWQWQVEKLSDRIRIALFFAEGAFVSAICEALHSARRHCEIGAGRTAAKQKRLLEEMRRREFVEAELRQARDRAEAAVRGKDRYIAMLSHELRTPLAPALAAAEMIETEPGLASELREHAVMIRRALELETRLIDDLLDLTKINWGKIELRCEPLDLHAAVRYAVQLCADDMQFKKLRLALTLSAANSWICADPARLQQILLNLLKNAMKFTPPDGEIRIRTMDATGDRIVLSISDTGQGIEPELLPRVFDAFEQGGARRTRQFGGLGLGLAICKALVELHGGELTAHSDGLGRGATFMLALEVSNPPQPADFPLPTPLRRPAVRSAKRLLLVDDDVETARILADQVRAEGYQVCVAATMQTALQAAATERFDVLICDIDLPDGSGLELLDRLSSTQTIKGIVLSGYGGDESVRRSRAAGFSAHLTKPVFVQVLLRTLREVMES